MNADLLPLDTELFLAACDVKDLEGDEAQQVVADALAGDSLKLEKAS